MHTMIKFLEHIAYNVRRSSLQMTTEAGSGHLTSGLSAAEILAALFFYAMRYDPKHLENPENDRFILSKGHAAMAMYAIYKELGVINEAELHMYRNFDSVLSGHPTPRFRWTEATTGSLGQGLSIGVGMALAARMDNRSYKTYVLLGDSELAEGSNWEAVEFAAYHKLNNLIGIVDCNRLGQRGETMYGYHTERYAANFQTFGWKTYIVDGHNVLELMGALEKAKKETDMPVMIIAKTVKGYGVKSVENKNGFHAKVFPKDELPSILDDLKQRFKEAADYKGEIFKPLMPINAKSKEQTGCVDKELKTPLYAKGELIEARKAFGQALAHLGGVCPDLVAFDAEVSNSTYVDFFAEKYPDRFIEAFVAEQNMVCMAVGMRKRGKMPYAATFGAFLTRAFDQIRMAAVGESALRLVGTHAGVSIGPDGPSEMALEDIAMMRAIFGSCVLYPCDAVSAWHLVNAMAGYNQGISYLRITRKPTPVIYDVSEEFPIGGCKVVKQSSQDKVCVIGAGITLHNALEAYTLLEREDIAIAVIDLYSIKPLDAQTILSVARASGNKIVTVEDHYPEGGLGEAVVYALRNSGIKIECLAVRKMPRSGAPERLMIYEEIDAVAIANKVKELL